MKPPTKCLPKGFNLGKIEVGETINKITAGPTAHGTWHVANEIIEDVKLLEEIAQTLKIRKTTEQSELHKKTNCSCGATMKARTGKIVLIDNRPPLETGTLDLRQKFAPRNVPITSRSAGQSQRFESRG